MRLSKILIVLMLSSMSILVKAQSVYVQPMGYSDYSFWSQANIGNESAKRTHASAYLELGKSTGSTKGFLLPRMTESQRNGISSPAIGLVVYNTTTGKVNFYNGSAWLESGISNMSIGSGFPVAITGTNNVRSLTGSNTIILDTAVSGQIGFNADTTTLATQNDLANKTTRLSDLIAANKANTINNGSFAQQWDWSGTGANAGLKLTNTGTASNNTNSVFDVLTYGSTAIGQRTYGMNVVNSRTGTGGGNIAARLAAYGKATSYALVVDSGNINVGINPISGIGSGCRFWLYDTSANESVNLPYTNGFTLWNRSATSFNSPAVTLVTSSAGPLFSMDVQYLGGFDTTKFRIRSFTGVGTTMAERFAVSGQGEFFINGDVGTNGYTLTSQGPGQPAFWAANGGGMTNPMTTAGDMIKGGASGTPERLAVGTEGQVLKVVSGAPGWSSTINDNIYNKSDKFTGNRIADLDSFSLTWKKAGLFRIEDSVVGGVTGIYDFKQGVDFLVANANRSYNITKNLTTGIKFIANDIANSTTKYFQVDTTGLYADGIRFSNASSLRNIAWDSIGKKFVSTPLVTTVTTPDWDQVLAVPGGPTYLSQNYTIGVNAHEFIMNGAKYIGFFSNGSQSLFWADTTGAFAKGGGRANIGTGSTNELQIEGGTSNPLSRFRVTNNIGKTLFQIDSSKTVAQRMYSVPTLRDTAIASDDNGHVEWTNPETFAAILRPYLPGGSSLSIGVSGAMTAGTITISTTAVTASSIIMLTPVGAGSGSISLGTVTAGTSFVINSSDNTDTRTVQWWIIN